MRLKVKNKISLICMEYLSLGNPLMLAKDNEVSIADIDLKKVEDFNAGRLPISDVYAQKLFVWL
jgi:UDP-glucose 6-dehydrogenase